MAQLEVRTHGGNRVCLSVANDYRLPESGDDEWFRFSAADGGQLWVHTRSVETVAIGAQNLTLATPDKHTWFVLAEYEKALKQIRDLTDASSDEAPLLAKKALAREQEIADELGL